MATCPTCGQTIKPKDIEADALLDLLTNGVPHREVYMAGDGSGWFVTYGGGRVNSNAVAELVRAEKIHSVYSNCPTGAYHVGKTLDVDATTAERTHRKDATRIYTDGTRTA